MTTQTLYYKARTTGNMWDTWLYQHDDVSYLYYLSGPGGAWNGIGLATSTDGVHWHEHGLILVKRPDVTWMGTGSVWQTSAPMALQPLGTTQPRFIINFSEWRGDAQTIFFAQSDDLIHWQRLGDEYEFRPDPRWYNTDGGNFGRWDCIYTIDRPEGGHYGYWTANPLNHAGIGFGFGESADGITWCALPSPRIDWGDVTPMPVVESGAVAAINGRFYTMLGTYQPYGAYASGMFTFVAEAPSGPFTPVKPNYALLASPLGRWHTYFARFFPRNGELLVNHHAIAYDGEVVMAPLKRAIVDEAGALRLMWWHGNDVVKRDETYTTATINDARTEITYEPSAGIVLEGRVNLATSQPSIHVGCGEGKNVIRFSIGAAGTCVIEQLGSSGTIQLIECIDREIGLKGIVSLRILAMHSFIELYLDDHLIQVHSLPAMPVGHIVLDGFEAHG